MRSEPDDEPFRSAVVAETIQRGRRWRVMAWGFGGLTVLLGIVTSSSQYYRQALFWNKNSVRTEVELTHAAISWRTLSPVRFHDSRKFHYGGMFSTRRPVPLSLKDTAELDRSGRSAWEGVGWQVKQRTRFLGYESATGTFIPPAYWMQSQTIHFEYRQYPLWPFILGSGLLAGFSYGMSVRHPE